MDPSRRIAVPGDNPGFAGVSDRIDRQLPHRQKPDGVVSQVEAKLEVASDASNRRPCNMGRRCMNRKPCVYPSSPPTRRSGGPRGGQDPGSVREFPLFGPLSLEDGDETLRQAGLIDEPIVTTRRTNRATAELPEQHIPFAGSVDDSRLALSHGVGDSLSAASANLAAGPSTNPGEEPKMIGHAVFPVIVAKTDAMQTGNVAIEVRPVSGTRWILTAALVSRIVA